MKAVVEGKDETFITLHIHAHMGLTYKRFMITLNSKIEKNSGAEKFLGTEDGAAISHEWWRL